MFSLLQRINMYIHSSKETSTTHLHAIPFENVILDNALEVLTIDNYTCNTNQYERININKFPNLRFVTIGDHCFNATQKLNFMKCNALEVIKVGSECFKSIQMKSAKVISCPMLKSFTVGTSSFFNDEELFIQSQVIRLA